MIVPIDIWPSPQAVLTSGGATNSDSESSRVRCTYRVLFFRAAGTNHHMQSRRSHAAAKSELAVSCSRQVATENRRGASKRFQKKAHGPRLDRPIRLAPDRPIRYLISRRVGNRLIGQIGCEYQACA